jgi:mgtE-like transporter
MAFDKDTKEIAIAQIVTVTLGVIGGGLLAFYTDQILLVPGLFILLPAFLGMRGNVIGTLASRLSSALHIGTIDLKRKKTSAIGTNIIALFILGLITSLLLGLMSYLISRFLFQVSNPKIILVAILAAIIANIILIPLTVILTLWLFSHGHDPDNIMGPYTSVMGDFVSIVALLLSIAVVA